jgi:hypothetical protein
MPNSVDRVNYNHRTVGTWHIKVIVHVIALGYGVGPILYLGATYTRIQIDVFSQVQTNNLLRLHPYATTICGRLTIESHCSLQYRDS